MIIQIEAPRDLLGHVMSVFNMDQGMRSAGSIVMGAFATIFGASLGIALTAAIFLIITSTLSTACWGKEDESNGNCENLDRKSTRNLKRKKRETG